MYGNEDFVAYFKIPVLLASFGGLPVPGAEKLLWANSTFRNIFRSISGFGIIVLVTSYIDLLWVTLYDENHKNVKYFLLGGINWVLGCILRTLYMLIRRKEWAGIIKQWDTSFRRPLFPDIRRIEHGREKKRVLSFIKWEYILICIPDFIWALSPVVTGKQGINSFLPWDHDNSPTFYLTAAYHVLYVYFVSLMCCANDSFLMIYVSLVAAELRYLNRSLMKILSGLRTGENEKVFVDEIYAIEELNYKSNELYEKKIKEIKSQLNVWVRHHAELLSFMIRLQHFCSPIVLLQYVTLVVSCCTMLFFGTSKDVPPTFLIVGVGIPMCLGGMLYIMCWFGEKIAIENERLSQEVFHHDWFLLPKDIQYSLRFIIMRTQRKMGLSAYSLMPLNIKSFEKIMKYCYSYFMFIRDSSYKN